MSLGRTFTLSSGHKLPAIGLGAVDLKEDIILEALKIGYRHIDTAEHYFTEQEVGNAIKKSGIPREEIFVTTKVWPNNVSKERLVKALKRSLETLQLDYVDLYLLHWPYSFVQGDEFDPKDENGLVRLSNPQIPIEETWAAMESLVEAGLVKSIGVSNFTIPKLEKLLSIAKIKPAVNQVELHPLFPQNELLEWSTKHDILLVGYTPLGGNHRVGGNPEAPLLPDYPELQNVAKRLGKTPASVLISWAVQRGTSPIPKTTNPERLRNNFEDYVIPDEIFNEINALDTGLARNHHSRNWPIDPFQD
jgi:L-glyceraldehyde reductase